MEDDNEEDDNEEEEKEEEKEEEEIADEEGKKEDEDVKTETTDGSSDFLNFSQQNNVVSKFFDTSFINDMFKNIEKIEDDSVVASFDKRKEDAVAVSVFFDRGEEEEEEEKKGNSRSHESVHFFKHGGSG